MELVAVKTVTRTEASDLVLDAPLLSLEPHELGLIARQRARNSATRALTERPRSAARILASR
jgi:hypothetical protein